ncbi:alpha/beta fold hydrolase [Streptomyces sp. NPDC046985]|uniref:alpha/beta fold hydrolase n=1 Tax=Streptomyces sp. NPDC046985 TaxID=3155377 RepID=UPI0034055768
MKDWESRSETKFKSLSNFHFDDGRKLDITLAYHTLGALNSRADNAVLALHGTTGSGSQFLQPSIADYLYGRGQPLDVTKYFVIMPDAIGHGRSSRPSDGLGPDFPRYDYTDMVEGQHRLVAEHLGINRLRLVLGTSMGGMQTWMWGQKYPDQQALMAIASLPEQITGRNLLWRRMLIELIRSDPEYADGHYGKQPAGLGKAMALFQLMTGGAEHMHSTLRSINAVDTQIKQIDLHARENEDANDVIWEFDASRDYNPAPGLREIRAPLLGVNFADDELNPVALGGLERAVAELPHGRAHTIPAGPETRGHQTLHAAEVWHMHLAEFLTQTEERS